ncbi:hypothetical protein J6590_012470 [Homalodisca vitripennis]|nr:hypothetical protein J6590_012470 [Homalodisca vitripennis]
MAAYRVSRPASELGLCNPQTQTLHNEEIIGTARQWSGIVVYRYIISIIDVYAPTPADTARQEGSPARGPRSSRYTHIMCRHHHPQCKLSLDIMVLI